MTAASKYAHDKIHTSVSLHIKSGEICDGLTIDILVISCFSALVCLHPEPELNSLLQYLHLVPPGMLHNRAWHRLAQDVAMGFCQWNHILVYITIDGKHFVLCAVCELSFEIMKYAAARGKWLVQCSQCDRHQAIACSRG
jgi:hypothetical protein